MGRLARGAAGSRPEAAATRIPANNRGGRRVRAVLAGIAVLLLATGCSVGWEPPVVGPPPDDPSGPGTAGYGSAAVVVQLGDVAGVALDRPVLHATVSVDGGAPVATTGGLVTLTRLQAGTHTLRVRATHLGERTVSFAIEPDQATQVTVRLAASYNAWEIDLLARLVHAEAAGEPFEGQVAVAATVLRRVASPRYPNTLYDVIYQKVEGYWQYSPVDPRINTINQPATRTQFEAVYEALRGVDPSHGATGFYNPDKVSWSSWVRQHPITARIGGHVFFLPREDQAVAAAWALPWRR